MIILSYHDTETKSHVLWHAHADSHGLRPCSMHYSTYDHLHDELKYEKYLSYRKVVQLRLNHWLSCGCGLYCVYHNDIRRNIGSALIWRIAESLRLVDFNIGGGAHGHVSNTLVYIQIKSFRGFKLADLTKTANPSN